MREIARAPLIHPVASETLQRFCDPHESSIGVAIEDRNGNTVKDL